MVVLCVCLVFVLHLSSSDIIVICVLIRVRSYVIKYLFKYEKKSQPLNGLFASKCL